MLSYCLHIEADAITTIGFFAVVGVLIVTVILTAGRQ